MKEKYSIKENNPSFPSKSAEQVLRDLHLMSNGRFTYAALILLGKRKAIQQYLPQACVTWEFRFFEGQIAHRDYTVISEVVIKQYPRKMMINNPGGFPKGVTVDILGAEQIIALYKIKMGNFARVKHELISSLEKDGLITRVGGHTLRYVLPEPYSQLATRQQQIGKRYVTREVEQLIVALQGGSPKIGDLEQMLKGSLNRNQLKYLITKLYEDEIVTSEGVGRGTKYKLAANYDVLTGGRLVESVVAALREKYARETLVNSPQ